jgi:hypothetical protein
MKKCTFCGREGSDDDRTKVVEGYTIFEYCTDCEKEIYEGKELDKLDSQD